MKKNLLLPLVALCMCFAGFSPAQPYIRNYKIYEGNRCLGELKASRTEVNNKVIYGLKSTACFRLVFQFKIEDKVSEVHCDNRVEQSQFEQLVNMRIKQSSKLKWINSQYHINVNGHSQQTISGDIATTVCTLYFNEPVNTDSVYSHSFGSMLPVKRTVNHEYALLLPDGNKTIFSYQNNECVKVTAHTTWATVIFLTDTPLAEKK